MQNRKIEELHREIRARYRREDEIQAMRMICISVWSQCDMNRAIVGSAGERDRELLRGRRRHGALSSFVRFVRGFNGGHCFFVISNRQ
jgi:hypothetical protein